MDRGPGLGLAAERERAWLLLALPGGHVAQLPPDLETAQEEPEILSFM